MMGVLFFFCFALFVFLYFCFNVLTFFIISWMIVNWFASLLVYSPIQLPVHVVSILSYYQLELELILHISMGP